MRTTRSGSSDIDLLYSFLTTALEGRGVSFTPWPLFTLEKDAISTVQKAGWAPGRSGHQVEYGASLFRIKEIFPLKFNFKSYGQDSVVGATTAYRLYGPGIEYR